MVWSRWLISSRFTRRSSKIRELFDHVLSIEEVRRYKPAPEPYHMVAERLGVGDPHGGCA
jgi:2-haloacid dehalogenase